MNEQYARASDIGPETLSALMDGEASADDTRHACAQWQHDARTRHDWNAFHLIGDSLRSTELCGNGRDAEFLEKMRARLASEPVLLAPTPAQTTAPVQALLPSRRLRRWAAPLGMAASVALVASAVWMRQPGNEGAAALVSGADNTSAATALASNGASQARTASASAEFEPYVAAHRQFQFTQTLGPASGYLRNARYDSTQR